MDLSGPADERDVKRAYARKLKAMDRTDVTAFENLRKAFDAARKAAQTAQGAPTGRVRPNMATLAAQAKVPLAQPPRPHDKNDRHEPSPIPDTHPLDTASPEPDQRETTNPPPKRERPAEALSPPSPSEKPKPVAQEVIAPPITAPHDQSADIVAEVVGPKITSAIEAQDIEALNAALRFVDGLDRERRRQAEAIIIRALNTDQKEIPQGIALAIDKVFDWSSDALVTEQTIRRVTGNALLYGRFVAAVLPASKKQASGTAPAPQDQAVEPEGVVSLVAAVLTLIHTGLETWSSESNAAFTFFIVFFSTALLLVINSFLIMVLIAGLRWVKRLLANITPPGSKARNRISNWDNWFITRRYTPKTVAIALATTMFFSFNWLVEPFLN